ncbi:MAG: sensor histidine kinase [Hahellaceae bacterium]|nr:sensor histidine kinase [Hahellaceae bacterium]MCP5209721.1 sensor histidine kinase [Hahellaceae bacterium]
MATVTEKRRYILLATLVVTGLLLTLYYGKKYATQSAHHDLELATKYELNRHANFLDTLLQKYESVPHLLSINRRLVGFLSDKGNKALAQQVNEFLETVNNISKSSDIYLLDPEGNTIAASNWNLPSSFIGRNFAFRPYFKTAMLSRQGRYFAIGTTSKKRGYYFSSPLTDDDEILGVIVLKIDLDEVEQSWSSPWSRNPFEVIISDEYGVIFMSTQARWRFKTLAPLSSESLATLAAHRRYDGVDLLPLQISSQFIYDDPQQLTRIVDIPAANGKTERYFSQRITMPQAGWDVQILSPQYAVSEAINILLIAIGATYLVIVLAGLYIFERRKNEKKLLAARDALESRVHERTQDLSESNLRLRKEIIEREKTERALHQTQDELIQTAKLAVLGQLSAGINHELSQPLTAIKTFARNAEAFYERGNHSIVKDNLQEISELTEHMAKIIAQYKIFARKTEGHLRDTDITQAIKAALHLLDATLRTQKINAHITGIDNPVIIQGDIVWLEQVLVNLLSNAVQAMQAEPEKKIDISLQMKPATIELSIRDWGTGISAESLPKLFEPFYTTKDISEGLGLGLSISQQIMEMMKGSLQARNHPEKGAIFTMIFPHEQN